MIALAPDGFRVERGTLRPTGGAEPGRAPAAEPERFPPDDLARAVQRACALAAEWLGYDEREVEQARGLFLKGA